MPDPAKQIPQSLQDSLTALQSQVTTSNKAMTDAQATIATLKGQVGVGMTQADVDNVKGQLDSMASSLAAAVVPPPTKPAAAKKP